MSKTEDAVARGLRAAAILNDPLWQEAWTHLRESLVTAMVGAKTDEGTIRGKEMLQVMVSVREHWERAIKDGQIKEHNIKLDAEEKKRFRLFAA